MQSITVAFQDLASTLWRTPLAMTLALDDLESRYRRTVLGPFWIVLGQAAMIFGMMLVFGPLFGQNPRSLTLYLAAGFPIWALMMSFLTDMPVSLIAAKGYIESYSIPWMVHVMRRSWGYIFVFFHQIAIFFAVSLIFQEPITPNILWAVPALFLIFVAGTGVGLALSAIGARYRDIHPAVGVMASSLFLFTPLMWRPEALTQNQWIVQYNPFYYFLELGRGPFLGSPPDPTVWLVCSMMTLVALIVGFLTFALSRSKLYHWI